jgi:hypothetical protein
MSTTYHFKSMQHHSRNLLHSNLSVDWHILSTYVARNT